MLQALDDGQLTDSLGRRVDFRNTIIIMTSNIGARQLQDFGTGVGFSTEAKKTKESDDRRGVIQNALKRAFAPEFLNRIDDVIVFNSLKRDDIHRIIDLELSKLFGRIESLGYGIKLTDAAKDFLVERATTNSSVRVPCAARFRSTSRTRSPRKSSMPNSKKATASKAMPWKARMNWPSASSKGKAPAPTQKPPVEGDTETPEADATEKRRTTPETDEDQA